MSKIGRWLVMEVGCLECGNSSEVLGTYATPEQARKAHPDAPMASELGGYGDWHGDAMVVIFDLLSPSPSA